MNRRITIKDIARELNLHHSTVSRALRNDPRVNAATRDEILEYAQKHEYQINMNAVQLRGTKNNAIALIVPNINHNFFADVVSRLTNLAYSKGYIISVFQSNEKYELEKEIINTVLQHNYAGVIVSIAKDTTNSDHFKLLSKFNIPVVFFDRVCEDVPAPKVIINNFDITYQATSYLLTKGYQRIAHLTGTTSINVFKDRENGYLQSLKDHKISYSKALIINDEFSAEAGRAVFRSLWTEKEKPDAIISSSVHLAAGILTEARRNKITIPGELGLITFGNSLASEVTEPGITYIDQPEMEIAGHAFSLLSSQIEDNNESVQQIIHTVEAKLVKRESC